MSRSMPPGRDGCAGDGARVATSAMVRLILVSRQRSFACHAQEYRVLPGRVTSRLLKLRNARRPPPAGAIERLGARRTQREPAELEQDWRSQAGCPFIGLPK